MLVEQDPRSFSGKWARGIKNKFILEMQKHETLLPDFPVRNILTQDIRKTTTAQNNLDFMSLWSRQSPRLAQSQTVEILIKNIIAEAKNYVLWKRSKFNIHKNLAKKARFSLYTLLS
jgi:NAD(P)H-dependent flavin oxidoreductase YrpB (nitropropane dioxygenase family)